MNSILRFVGCLWRTIGVNLRKKLPAVGNRAYTNKTHLTWVKEEVRLRGRKLV